MPGHKTTHSQLERFRLIDSLLADGDIIPFEKLLDSLRLELRDDLLSDSSLRRDFRYMKNELGAPLAYDKKLHGWHYTKPFKLPAEGFSDDEILYLELMKSLVNQNSNDDFLYKSFDKLLNKIIPARYAEKETLKQVQGDDIQPHGDSLRHAEQSCHAELVSASIRDRFYIAPRPKQLIDEGVVEKVLEAIKNNYLLDFNYFSKWEPEERHRKIMPFQLVFDSGSMYLYAASSNPRVPGPRLYKLSKMHNVQVITSKTFDLPANFRFREAFEEGRFGAFQYDEAYDFKIEFLGDARSVVRECIWADNQNIEENQKEGRTIISFTSSQWIPVFRWLLSFGENAHPLEPDWLVEQWKQSVRKMSEKIKK